MTIEKIHQEIERQINSEELIYATSYPLAHIMNNLFYQWIKEIKNIMRRIKDDSETT